VVADVDEPKRSGRRDRRRGEDGLSELEREFLSWYLGLGATGDAGWRAYQKCNPNAAEQTCRGESAKLLKRPHVRLVLAQQQREMIERGACSLEQHLRELAELRDEAKQAGEYNAAIKAEELRGKACGLYVERVEHTGEPESRWTSDWSSRIDFARRVAFVLKLGERAIDEGKTVEHQALPAPDEPTTH